MIADGSAFAKCKEMFAAQGGNDTRALDDYSLFEQPAASFELLAEQDGYIVANDAEKIGSASASPPGAGRQKKGDPLDFAAGITLHKKRGDYVHRGESLATFYGAADKFETRPAGVPQRSGLWCGKARGGPAGLRPGHQGRRGALLRKHPSRKEGGTERTFSMKIILVGCGKVGTALARQLSEEGHNVTVIDTNKARVEHISESYDVMGITGNGSSIATLSEAGIEEADVFIAVTGSDELNLLCCMFAKKAGHCHAIARVRNPSYSHELDFIKKQIGISAIINPEMAAAREIPTCSRFPGASKIDTFAEGRVRLIKFTLTEAQALDGVAIREYPRPGSRAISWSAPWSATAGSSSPTVILCSRPAIRSPFLQRRKRPTRSSSASIWPCARCAMPSSWAAVPLPST